MLSLKLISLLILKAFIRYTTNYEISRCHLMAVAVVVQVTVIPFSILKYKGPPDNKKCGLSSKCILFFIFSVGDCW